MTRITLAAALAMLAAIAASFWLRLARVEVAGESMAPALQAGDFVLLRPGPPPRGREYGAVVALADPRGHAEPDAPPEEPTPRLLLKRIVGLPGESLRVGGGPVQINGRVLIERYAHGTGPQEQHRGINRLEPDEYFLIGDHRGASTDSRDFGPVHRDRIEATAILCYWPPERFGRLDRPPRELAGVASPDGGGSPIPIARPTGDAPEPGDATG